MFHVPYILSSNSVQLLRVKPITECVLILQKALASRLKDIEMFSGGIMQQMIRRQENLSRTNLHLQKGTTYNYSLQ